MDGTTVAREAAWAPEACTLPTAQQPLRVAEFDGLFATAVRSVQRPDPQLVRLELVPDASVAARAADLMVRESECCSFFTFTVSATAGRVWLDVAVPEQRVGVLAALADRVAERVGS